MLREIADLGFGFAELSHGVPVYLVEGIQRALDEGLIRISSVHNFCPLPSMALGAAPNLFQPSTKRGVEQRAWLRYSLETLRLAQSTGAQYVVMHSGSVQFRRRSPDSILLASGEDEDHRDRDKALARLEKKASRAMPRVEASYHELLPHAREANLCLAAENREGILELPLDKDWPDFFARVSDDHLVYWHDTGHAELKRRLGLLDDDTHLSALADKLAGFHLHDVDESGRDHRTIGTGTVDFEALSTHFRPHHIPVLELSPRLSREDVIVSRTNLLHFFS